MNGKIVKYLTAKGSAPTEKILVLQQRMTLSLPHLTSSEPTDERALEETGCEGEEGQTLLGSLEPHTGVQ